MSIGRPQAVAAAASWLRALPLLIILLAQFPRISQAAPRCGEPATAFAPTAAKLQPSPELTEAVSPQSSSSQKLRNPLNDLLDEAQHDIDAGQYEAAIAPLQKFLAEKPEVAYAHFQLAYAYTGLKRPADARPEYERAIALDPKMSAAYLNLGILLLESEPSAAVQPLQKAVDLLPAQSRPRILLGMAQERSGDFARAADSFEGAARLDPKDLDAVVHLGDLDLKLKRPAGAEREFRAALEIQPKLPKALYGLAVSLDAQKSDPAKIPEAAEAYRSYLAVKPDDPTARERLIHLFLDSQQYDAALAELQRSEAGKPPSLDSLRMLADIQIAQKQFDAAIKTLQQAVALAPNDAQLIGGLGRVYMQKRDFPSAEKYLKAALQIDHNNLVYWKDLSSTYYLSGNCQAALAALDVIGKAEPPSSGSWFVRALCYDKLNDIKPALEAYQKFLDMNQGKSSDQVWQAQQRSKVLKRMLEDKR